jgi:4'-phosphopantetheinyl transferase
MMGEIDWLVCPADECPAGEWDGLDSQVAVGHACSVTAVAKADRHVSQQPGFLSASECEMFCRLVFPKRRREWLLGRWTAKRLLQRHLPCDAKHRLLPLRAITVGNDPDGAPYLAVEGEGRLPASLSISHRGGRRYTCRRDASDPFSSTRAFCALSFSHSLSLGADIERVEPRVPAFVHDYFTAREVERVQACPPQARDLLVTVLWSAKEAVLKALRLGLRVDTRRVEIGHVAGIMSYGTSSTDVSPGGWRPVWVKSDLAGGDHLLSWWRLDGDDVLTLAVVRSGEKPEIAISISV